MDYPSPRYPSIRQISREEIFERVDKFVVNPPQKEIEFKKEGTRILWRGTHFPTYDSIGESDKVLLAAATEYDHDVIDAYANALRKHGARVDVYLFDLGRLGTTAEEMGAQEAASLVPGEDNPVYTKFCNIITSATARALIELEGYTILVAGTAGPVPKIEKNCLRMQYISRQEIASRMIEFPMEIQLAIDRKVFEQISSIERARLTDPEGTDISWTNYDDKRLMYMGHEFGKPVNVGFGGVADCTGLVAGTTNHVGAFPNIKATLKDDLVTKVEGGGKYGELWQEKIEELNKTEFPPVGLAFAQDLETTYRMPGPGFFWFWELAIGTMPGAFRLRKEAQFELFANFLHDRIRSGWVHNGFGAPSGNIRFREEQVFSKINLPWTHVHIHNMFATLEGTTKDGSKVRIIDKGHLTALDDPQIRKLPQKYGEPDELLKEAWIPAIPGINESGNYAQDYGSNPEEWIRREAERLP
jgi:hypothetical protein